MIKLIKNHWHWRRERFYRKNKWHLVLDIFLTFIILSLLSIIIAIHHYHPDISRLIGFHINHGEKIDLSSSPINLEVGVEEKTIHLGEEIKINVKLKNTFSRSIKDIKLNFDFNDGFSLDDLVIMSDKVKVNGYQIIIKSLDSNEKIELPISLRIKSNYQHKVIKPSINVNYIVNGQEIKDSIDLSKVIVISSLKATQVAYYNSPQGDQLGAGPLPPIAYLPTNYWIFWQIKPGGEFKDFVMTAQLPPGVELTDRKSLLAGKFTYNSSSRKIIWQVNRINLGKDVYRLGFEIQLIPEEEQVGKILPLIVGTRYYAQDILSGAEVSKSLGNLSTNLDFDKINKGQGKILNQ